MLRGQISFTSSNELVLKKMRKRKSERLLTFIITFVGVFVTGFIFLHLTDIGFSREDPLFYPMVIPGLFGGAFFFALMTSLERKS